MVQRLTTRVLVVGSGVAGLFTAWRCAEQGPVLLMTKRTLRDSNTMWAQGGIAAALGAGDSPELHRRDTLAAGAALCDVNAKNLASAAAKVPGAKQFRDFRKMYEELRDAEFDAGCALAARYQVASVCIKPYAVRRGVERLAGKITASRRIGGAGEFKMPLQDRRGASRKRAGRFVLSSVESVRLRASVDHKTAFTRFDWPSE